MAFSRKLFPREPPPEESVLMANLVGIGMNFAASASPNPNIEDTILQASIEGMQGEDLRILSVLTSWLDMHCACLNVDRLTHIVANQQSDRVKAYWSSVAKWLIKDRRFSKMLKLYNGLRIDLLKVGTEFQIQRRGEDERFSGAALRVPALVLRDRKADVLTPEQLVRIHRAYRWRTIIGPSYRADMWAELEQNASLTAAELARRAYGSFATAWKVRRDWSVVHATLETLSYKVL